MSTHDFIVGADLVCAPNPSAASLSQQYFVVVVGLSDVSLLRVIQLNSSETQREDELASARKPD
jgi:hypothetical protein